MNDIIRSKTLESDYFALLVILTGGLAMIPWYYWIGGVIQKLGAIELGKGAIFFASAGLLFVLIGFPFSFFSMLDEGSSSALVSWLFDILILGLLSFYFGWNELFRRRWNQIETVAGHEEFKAGPLWTLLLGPLYLTFKINQAKGIER